MKCTFFGHRDAEAEIEERLRNVILNLIENKGITCFYVGTHGNFDKMAYNILCEMFKVYDIQFFTVLPCIPIGEKYKKYINTIVPEGLKVCQKDLGLNIGTDG